MSSEQKDVKLSLQDFYDKTKDTTNGIYYSNIDKSVCCIFYSNGTFIKYMTDYKPEYELSTKQTYKILNHLILDKFKSVLRYKKIQKINNNIYIKK